MMRVPTQVGGIVTLLWFDVGPCVIDLLIDLQTTLPRYELALEGGAFVQARCLNFDREAIQSLNAKELQAA